jgi:hypothetical protein
LSQKLGWGDDDVSSTAIFSSLSAGVELSEHGVKLLVDLSKGQDSEPFGHDPTNLAVLPYSPLLALTIVRAPKLFCK